MKRLDELSQQVEDMRREFIAKNRHLHVHNLNALRSARAYVDRGTQLVLKEMYQEKADKGDVYSFKDVEFSNYSQHGEDGALHYIFSLVGVTNRVVVEMSAGVCEQCNATNLIINDNWRGFLFEGNDSKLDRGRAFFKRHFASHEMPMLVNAWITKDNINKLISDCGVRGDIDLFSLDVDGVDYWLLDALDVVSPRVIIAEAQLMWGPDAARTVPYKDDFSATPILDGGKIMSQHLGASVGAFVEFGKSRGYRLVGMVGTLGPNIILLREDVGSEFFPEIQASELFEPIPLAFREHFERCRELASDFLWIDL
ncbi:MAG: hypothetical protein AAF583_12035 [Pseudomonadota bacterium]